MVRKSTEKSITFDNTSVIDRRLLKILGDGAVNPICSCGNIYLHSKYSSPIFGANMEIRWPGVGVLKILPVGSSRETSRLTKGGLLDRWEFCAAGQPLEEARVIRLGSSVGSFRFWLGCINY